MSAHVDFPVCVRLAGRPVLLVGAGFVGSERCASLVAAGARVTVVSPLVSGSVEALAAAGAITLVRRAFEPQDVTGMTLVFAATNNLAVSQVVASSARAAGVLVNCADMPELCDFTLPSVGRRGPITVAVSTSGRAPALARSVKNTLMGNITHRHIQLARLTGWLRRRIPAGPERMAFIRTVIDGDVGTALLAGERRTAVKHLRASLAALQKAA